MTGRGEPRPNPKAAASLGYARDESRRTPRPAGWFGFAHHKSRRYQKSRSLPARPESSVPTRSGHAPARPYEEVKPRQNEKEDRQECLSYENRRQGCRRYQAGHAMVRLRSPQAAGPYAEDRQECLSHQTNRRDAGGTAYGKEAARVGATRPAGWRRKAAATRRKEPARCRRYHGRYRERSRVRR